MYVILYKYIHIHIIQIQATEKCNYICVWKFCAFFSFASPLFLLCFIIMCAAQSNPPPFGYAWGFADNGNRAAESVLEISPNINYTVSGESVSAISLSLSLSLYVYIEFPSLHITNYIYFFLYSFSLYFFYIECFCKCKLLY